MLFALGVTTGRLTLVQQGTARRAIGQVLEGRQFLGRVCLHAEMVEPRRMAPR